MHTVLSNIKIMKTKISFLCLAVGALLGIFTGCHQPATKTNEATETAKKRTWKIYGQEIAKVVHKHLSKPEPKFDFI